MTTPIRTYRGFETVLQRPEAAKTLVRWFHRQGVLPEYRLALEEDGWEDNPG